MSNSWSFFGSRWYTSWGNSDDLFILSDLRRSLIFWVAWSYNLFFQKLTILLIACVWDFFGLEDCNVAGTPVRYDVKNCSISSNMSSERSEKVPLLSEIRKSGGTKSNRLVWVRCCRYRDRFRYSSLLVGPSPASQEEYSGPKIVTLRCIRFSLWNWKLDKILRCVRWSKQSRMCSLRTQAVLIVECTDGPW